MVFNSKKSALILVIIAFVCILTIISLFGKVYPVLLIFLLVDAFTIWAWFDTYYTVTGTQLLYKCALLKGAIEISTIIEVVKNKTMYSGLKPALAPKGLTIRYNKWDDIYISPEKADEFIKALIAINPNIKVVE